MKNKKFFPVAEPSLEKEELDNAIDAIKSGWISSRGEYIELFERNFSKYIGTRFGSCVMNGTVALHITLKAFGIKSGDEIIIPDLTFVATANAVIYLGAIPVFVDVDPETWCIDVTKIERAITKKTKAIIPVHLYGNVANMGVIMKIARKYNLIVIEDAAEAHGAQYHKKRVGGIGHAGIFSFFGNKIITTGEGGMIVTNNREIDKKIKFLRNQAQHPQNRYWHTDIGFNYRMTNIQAAIGVAQLKKISSFLKKKEKLFHWYRKYLRDVPLGVIYGKQKEEKSVFWMISFLLREGANEASRDNIMRRLKAGGIETRPFFYPLSKMLVYKKIGRAPTENKVAYSISKRGFNLPSGINLKEKDIQYISNILKNIR